MSKKKIKIESTEQLIGLLEGDRELSHEEMTMLLQDDELMDEYRELTMCRSAIVQECDSTNRPDVEKEWELFEKNTRRRRPNQFVLGAVSGVAASLIIGFFLFWFSSSPLSKEELLAFEANDNIYGITLRTGQDNLIPITKSTQSEALKALGISDITIAEESVHGLTYTQGAGATATVGAEQAPQAVERHILSTPRGQDFKVVLADGTKVWLNAESSLEYPSHFTADERVVGLSGEAYFEVAKDSEHPFIVQTNNMLARVLGTEINVCNYAEGKPSITLIDGSVEVSGERKKEFLKLTPGNSAQWLEGDSFTVKEVDLDKYVYRKQGYFYFDDVPLIEVMQSLGRWYNLNVIFDNKDKMDLRMRYFCIRDESVERAISLLNHTKRIKAEIVDNTIYIR